MTKRRMIKLLEILKNEISFAESTEATEDDIFVTVSTRIEGKEAIEQALELLKDGGE